MMRLLLLLLGVVFSHGANEPHDWDFLHCNLHPSYYPQFKISCDNGYLTAALGDQNINSEIQKIKQLQMNGQCLNPSTSNAISKNRVRRQDDSTYYVCEFEDCTGTASLRQKAWRRCDYSAAGGYCYGDWMDEAKNPNLHVIIVIDMAVDDEDFWRVIVPTQIRAHLKSIPFVIGTTYEVLFVGPDGVKFNYPVWNGQRWRRDTSAGQTEDPSHCIITDREVLVQRIREVVRRVPASAYRLLQGIGLNYESGLGFISDYMEEFAPVDKKNVLFLHAISRNVDVSASQFNNFMNFITAYEAAHPDTKLMNHFMFAESASPMLAQIKNLGAKNSGKIRLSLGFLNVAGTDSLLGYEEPAPGTGVITDVAPTSCSANPCLNGCTCQQSCRDENDYVCVPQPGRPFVGKNCEFEATVQCTANRSIRISVPTAAIDQYAIGVSNVIVQGCNNAPSYICNNQPSCGPATTSVGGFYTLECTNNQLIESGGVFKFQQTFIFDRASEVISMPRPIVKVECNMQTRPATSLITPQIRDPNTMTQTIFWQPAFQFYKTAWGQPMILANNGERLANGAVAYIIGERIHVRIHASLNGVAPQSLPNRYEISLESCSIASSEGGSSPILIISNGLAVGNTPFPVSVDHPIGFMGGGVPVESMGVGFAFQVFTFGAGASLQLTCSVSVRNGRRKRSAVEEEEEESVHGRRVIAKLLLFEKAYNNEEEIPVLAIEQEPFPRNTEDLSTEYHTVSDLPVWIMVLFGLVVFAAVMMGGLCYRRNYVVKPHFDMEDTKVRLFN